jgi:hypothetical protein
MKLPMGRRRQEQEGLKAYNCHWQKKKREERATVTSSMMATNGENQGDEAHFYILSQVVKLVFRPTKWDS